MVSRSRWASSAKRGAQAEKHRYAGSDLSAEVGEESKGLNCNADGRRRERERRGREEVVSMQALEPGCLHEETSIPTYCCVTMAKLLRLCASLFSSVKWRH